MPTTSASAKNNERSSGFRGIPLLVLILRLPVNSELAQRKNFAGKLTGYLSCKLLVLDASIVAMDSSCEELAKTLGSWRRRLGRRGV
jgi:hypothetical protein